jgi:molecular chaperone DnaK
LKEFGDKVSADKKAPIEAALNKLKEAHKAQDLTALDAAMNELNAAWTAASEEMYKASQQAGGAEQAGAEGGAQGGGQSSSDNVEDAQFEEVK